MEMTSILRDTMPEANATGIAMYKGHVGARYQVGDPGRYLAPGLFPVLIETLRSLSINPAEGYTVELTNPETGQRGRISGFSTNAPGIVVPDQSGRDLGEFTSETGHIAIADMALCVEPEACDQCRWIIIDEMFTVCNTQGALLVQGSSAHVHIATRNLHTTIENYRLAA